MRYKLGAYTFIIKIGQFTNGRECIVYKYIYVAVELLCEVGKSVQDYSEKRLSRYVHIWVY